MIDTVLFDFDGTIVDTNELIIATFLHILQGHTPQQPFTREHIIPHMGSSLAEQLSTFTGRTDVEDLIKAYREYNGRIHDEMVRSFPYVKEVLERLQQSGIKMGVVTNKVQFSTRRGLKMFELDGYMDAVVTADEVSAGKPDPEGILLAVSRLGSDPERTLMVGDSQYDMLAAHAAGVKAVGVAWSLKGEEYLKRFEPHYMLHDMRDLYEIVGLGEG
ncbi:pyrophosphatase PpaX [Gorillibacterium massiliense]|uniref:pyrophosphatase PpaX n=1 Tax=Gorillibacterium massiliense TaxID=1280390 RepID=UPI0004B1441E|nr:pyrophosphatase PpaX [Gorillibacterium massiliense]